MLDHKHMHRPVSHTGERATVNGPEIVCINVIVLVSKNVKVHINVNLMCHNKILKCMWYIYIYINCIKCQLRCTRILPRKIRMLLVAYWTHFKNLKAKMFYFGTQKK